MADEQTSFRNDFEREFWAKVYTAFVVSSGVANAAKWADYAVVELRKRQAESSREHSQYDLSRSCGDPNCTMRVRDATSLVGPTNERRPELKTGMRVVHRRTGARYVLREIAGDTATVTWETIVQEKVPLVELIEDIWETGGRQGTVEGGDHGT